MIYKNFLNPKLNLLNLYPFLKQKRKLQLRFLAFTMLLSALFEAFTVASLIPFLSLLTNPKDVSYLKTFKYLFNFLNLN